jgi:hypothetical protein
MENTNNPQKNNPSDEKTVVFGASSKNDESNAEKTTINNNADKTEFQSSASISKEPDSNEKEIPNASKNIPKVDTQKSSTGAFVATAGVAGVAAGIAGVAAGTIFSEDIKNVFSSEAFDAPESPEDEIQDATSSAVTDNSTNTVETDHAASNASDNIHASSFEASSIDAQGNTYTVSLVDENSDGHIDIASGEAHMVDGSTVSFTGSGDTLDSIFQSDVSIASATDFGSQPQFVHIPTNMDDIPFASDTMSYEIQSGDTLSEIAAAHNTSVEHLMDLNPDITDANMIYAGDDLVIQTTDHINNPYEGLDNPQNNDSSFIVSNDSVSIENSSEPTEEGNFEAVDWASFNDEPVMLDEQYDNALAQSDFDSFDTPSDYLESGNDFVSSEFI